MDQLKLKVNIKINLLEPILIPLIDVHMHYSCPKNQSLDIGVSEALHKELNSNLFIKESIFMTNNMNIQKIWPQEKAGFKRNFL